MLGLRRSVVVLGLVAIAFSCDNPTGPGDDVTGPSNIPVLDGPDFVIRDGANGGTRGFYFLPPMVPNPGPTFTGTFDAGFSTAASGLTARVCTISGCGTSVATFAVGAAGKQAITVNLAGQSYNANWQTPSNLALGATHRLEVYVGTIRVGFADLYVVQNSKALKNVPSGYVAVVRGSPLQIKFRIETGVVGTVTVAPATSSIQIAATQGFTATVTDLHGNPIASPTVAWTSDNTAVATISPASGTSTTATGVTGGTANIVATSGGVPGQAALTVTANAAPSAVDDNYNTPKNTALSVPDGGTDLLANDALGTPAATITSFGGGDLGGAVTDNAAASTATFGTGGSLTVNADGSFDFTPATDFAGTFTFDYRITNATGSSEATVSISVDAPPANDDAYTATGNIAISIASAGVLANDNPASGTTVTEVQGSAANVGTATNTNQTGIGGVSGRVTLNADGSFTYDPPPGYTGNTDTFTYKMTNGTSTSNLATVTITLSNIMWFVCDACTSNNRGTLLDPFTSVGAFTAANTGAAPAPQPNHIVYIEAGTYDGASDNLTLRDGQKAYGQGVSASSLLTPSTNSVAAFAALTAGTSPTISPSAGNTVTLGNGNRLDHLALGGNAAGKALVGSSFGTLTVAGVSIDAAGQAVDLNTGTISGDFTSVDSDGGTNNILLTTVATSGTTDFGNGALSGATGDGFKISGGSGSSFSYAGSISNAATLAVNISAKTGGGGVTLSGDINPSAAGKGISVTGNAGVNAFIFSGANVKISAGAGAGVTFAGIGSGGAISFTGGGLAIATTTGKGFVASGGGTVTVTGSGNTIASTTGTALDVQNVTIGVSGLTFQSISADGAANGIVLNTTGTGGLTVTGDGASDAATTTRGRTTAKSGGGTLALGSGGTIANTTSHAVSLTSTGPVTMRNMVLQSGGGDGISATTVAGLVLDNLLVTGKALGHGLHGTSVAGLTIVHSDFDANATDASTAASDIWNVRLDNLSGTGTVSSSLFHNGYEHIFVLKNTSGAATFNATNSNFTDAGHGDGLDVYAYGTSTITATVQNDSLARNSALGFDAGTQTGASGALSVTLDNNKFRNNLGGLHVAHGSSGTNSFNITNNNLQTNVVSSASAIDVNRVGSASFTSFGLFHGTISGNTIGTAGTANSGSDVDDGITVETNGNGGTIQVSILNNTIREVGRHGIFLASGEASTGHTLEARVQNNSVSNMEATAFDGVNVLLGALNTDHTTVCLNVSANTTTAIRTGIRARPSGAAPGAVTTVRLQGWDGATAVAAYLAGLNPSATGGSSATDYANGGGTTVAGNCTTP